MEHNEKLCNGIWSEMAIDTRYRRYGHEMNGLLDLTNEPELLRV